MADLKLLKWTFVLKILHLIVLWKKFEIFWRLISNWNIFIFLSFLLFLPMAFPLKLLNTRIYVHLALNRVKITQSAANLGKWSDPGLVQLVVPNCWLRGVHLSFLPSSHVIPHSLGHLLLPGLLVFKSRQPLWNAKWLLGLKNKQISLSTSLTVETDFWKGSQCVCHSGSTLN